MMKYVLVLALIVVGSFSLEGVTEINDQNFGELVQSEPSFWILLFAADWCGHCQKLKPEFEKLAPMLEKYDVKLGIVNEKNQKLVNDYVVDHKTHMVSYPKMKVFLGEQLMGDVPPGARTAQQILGWFVRQYNLEENAQL